MFICRVEQGEREQLARGDFGGLLRLSHKRNSSVDARTHTLSGAVAPYADLNDSSDDPLNSVRLQVEVKLRASTVFQLDLNALRLAAQAPPI